MKTIRWDLIVRAELEDTQTHFSMIHHEKNDTILFFLFMKLQNDLLCFNKHVETLKRGDLAPVLVCFIRNQLEPVCSVKITGKKLYSVW